MRFAGWQRKWILACVVRKEIYRDHRQMFMLDIGIEEIMQLTGPKWDAFKSGDLKNFLLPWQWEWLQATAALQGTDVLMDALPTEKRDAFFRGDEDAFFR